MAPKVELIGKTLGAYCVEGHLGQGAMGTVYKAIDVASGAACALKVLSADDQTKPEANLAARFQREIKLLSQFQHPNIVRIYAAADFEGLPYYAMELIDGQSLEHILRKVHKLPYDDALRYGLQLCDALSHIHYHGVIHRDLKPANVMVTRDDVVKLTDFGIAKDISRVHGTQLTKADHTVGTVSYMSPEQLSGGELGPASDLYSFGIVLYRTLCGRLPFIGESMFEYMNQRMAGAFALPSAVDKHVPIDFDALVRSLLAQRAIDRPESAIAVKTELLAIQERAVAKTLQWRQPLWDPAVPLGDTVVVPAALPAEPEHKESPTGDDSLTDESIVQPIASRASVFESTYFLLAVLAVLVVTAIYMLLPPGPEDLLKSCRALLASNDPADWDAAMKNYCEPLLAQYPNSLYAAEIDGYRDKVEHHRASVRVNLAVALGRPRREAGEKERLLIQARLAENAGNIDRARQLCQQVMGGDDSSAAERVWTRLAQELLERCQVSEAAQRIPAP